MQGPAITQMSQELVFLTGASGFLGSYIAAKLLAKGYALKAAFRTQQKSQEFLSFFPGKNIYTCIVPEITAPGAYDNLLNGCTYVIHCASPYTFQIDDVQKDLIEPAVKGTSEIFRAVSSTHGIKRVVVTSSFAAVVNPFEGPRAGYRYTENDWNPITPEKAADNKILGYQASKKYAEQVAWDFLKSQKAEAGEAVSVVTVNPPMIYGPPHKAAQISLTKLNQSSALLVEAIRDQTVAPARMPVFVDVRDVAEIHVKALDLEVLPTSERFVVCGGKYTWSAVRDIVKGGVATVESLAEAASYYSIDASKVERMLGVKWTPLATSIKDFVAAVSL